MNAKNNDEQRLMPDIVTFRHSRTSTPAVDAAYAPPTGIGDGSLGTSPRPSGLTHRASPRRTMLIAVAASIGVAGVAAAIEWAGWKILWRHFGPSPLDRAWYLEFLAGTGRTMLGALGVGAGVAAIVRLVAAARSWDPGTTRRRVVRGFGAGVIGLLALLASVTFGAL